MHFDSYPRSPESIIQPNGDLVIPKSSLTAVAIGSTVSLMATFGTIQAVVAWGASLETLGIGLLSFVVGVVVCLITYEIRVDRAKGLAFYRWGIGRPALTAGPRRLDDFAGVVFGHYVIRARGGSHRVDFVGLQEAHRDGWFQLTLAKNESESRRYGEAIAKALEIPLYRKDSPAAPRDPNELDQKLYQRVACAELPSPPSSMRTKVEREQDQLTLHIPGPDTEESLKTRRLLAISAISLCSIFMAIGMLSVPQIESWIAWTLLALVLPCDFALYLIIFDPMIRRQANQNARLTLTAEQLTVWELDGNGVESTTEFALRELEEFFHDASDPDQAARSGRSIFADTSASPLVASSDNASASFASWLPPAEKDYIVALVHQLIAQSQQIETTVEEAEFAGA